MTHFSLFRAHVLVLAACIMPGALAAQLSNYERARAGLSASAVVEFDRTVNDARARGLPIGPLVDKTLEGEAKHVPPDRIVGVLHDITLRMESARTALGG